MRMNLNMNKAGVSLIAVLLFMLIATIAATATWKWITSEGWSSTSRMLHREALQSSQAGIDNARAWMTFHANELGALVKQFVEDPNHNPINITERLRPFQRADQTYKVWVTGVNTENSTYKIKILSSGEARNNTRHTEVAIFNVDGLYQVAVPQNQVHKHTNFEYSYFGGGFTSTQVTMTSAAVNGNWSGNPPVVEDVWVVTGNATLSGDNVHVGGTACIGGKTSTENNGFSAGNLFVGGKFEGLLKETTGDVYFDGDVTHGGTGSIYVQGNATVNGILRTAQNAGDRDVKIDGNLCVSDTGAVVSQGTTDSILVKENVWFEGDLWYGTARRTGCKCNKWSYACTVTRYSDNAVVPYNYACTMADEGRHSNSQNGIIHVRKVEIVGIEDCEEDNEDLISCTGKEFTVESDNYSTYDKIILGSKSTSKVYVKGARSVKEYNEHSDERKGEEKTTHVKKCGGDNYKCTSPEMWTTLDYYPYSHKNEDKTDQYYIWNLPDSVTDIAYGSYTDHYWSDATVYSYFINFTNDKKDTSTRFTDSYHSKGYRYLNYSGTHITGSPYCKLKNGTGFHPECGVNPWFQSKASNVHSIFGSRDFACGETVKRECDEIWDKVEGCDGAHYQIPDALVTAIDRFEGYAQKGCAQNITTWPETGFETTLQNCYEENYLNPEKRKANLYNDFLVVDLTQTDQNYIVNDNSPVLEGKYIIIVEDTLRLGQNGLPKTSDNSYVFLYLKKGAKYIQKTANNYFIFTLEDIGNSSDLHLTGSVYAPTASCAKARFQDSELTFSQNLVQVLTDALIICDAAEGSNCGDASDIPDPDPDHLDDVDEIHSKDRFFISMAPQLGVTLESQSKSNEWNGLQKKISNGEVSKLDSSFIVLPRVLNLPNDPYGKFEDYLKVVPLNGSHLTMDGVKIDKCEGLNGAMGNLPESFTTRLYVAGDETIPKGSYKCTVKANVGYDNQRVPFWVVIGNGQRAVPTVSFTKESQEIGKSDTKMVSIVVSPHELPITVNVFCPDNKPANWSYNPAKDPGSICSYHVDAEPDEESVINLFEIKTENATSGTMVFQILAGEGYNFGEYPQTDIHMASTITLTRVEANDEIADFCSEESNAPLCPEDIHNWPDCKISGVWVAPNISFIENDRNNSWTIPLKGTGSLRLVSKTNDCVVIIPDEALSMSTLDAGSTYALKASAKAPKRRFKAIFKGNPGTGRDPFFKINVVGGNSYLCKQSESDVCEVDLFSGQKVSLYIDQEISDNENFSYWKCAGGSCPTTAAITEVSYDAFEVNDNETVVYVHFGEVDKHCFFEEFKRSSIRCTELNANNRIYCIDYCGDVSQTSNQCESAGPTGHVYENAKWHLVDGYIGDLVFDSRNGYLSVGKDKNVTVMSTVNAGRSGTLKALVDLTRVGSSLGMSDDKIRNTGFLLRSNDRGTSYLMLNVYIDSKNRVAAQICTENGDCLSDALFRNGIPLSTKSSMVMITATLTRSDELIVSAYEGDYYGSPKLYTKTFMLSRLPETYNSANHEFVGFRLANANFKLYGIGWISEEYASECHETYPIVKCSFAAKAVDGVVPTETLVKPWVGHSGWFDSREYDCETKFYYYNGGDASCGSATNDGAVCLNGYVFDKDSAGRHGYNNTDGNAVRTAKAGIQCTLNGQDGMWAANPEDPENGEMNRAHCGTFWTGKYTECTSHADLFSGELYLPMYGDEQSATFSSKNLRDATLNVLMDNPENSEVEVWLYSNSERYGEELYASLAKVINGNSGSFEVTDDFAGELGGFNPEQVVQVAFRNKGTGTVTVKSVTAACSHAIGVAKCYAELDDKNWTIKAQIINLSNVHSFNVSGNRKDKGILQEDHEIDVTNGWQNKSDVVQNDNEVSFTYCDKDPAGNCKKPSPGTFSFNVAVSLDGSTAVHSQQCAVMGSNVEQPRCEVHSPKPDPGQTRKEITSGKNNPQFHVVLHHCEGCEYILKFNNETFYTESCPDHGPCDIKKTADGKSPVGADYTYSIVSAADPALFESCEAKFDVVAAGDPVTVTNCPTTGFSNHDPDQAVVFTPTVTGCGPTGCSYSITNVTVGQSGTYTSGNLSFYKTGASGEVAHKLTMTNASGRSGECTFTVTYVPQSSSSQDPVESSSSENSSSSSEQESSSSSELVDSSDDAESSSSEQASFNCDADNSTDLGTVSGGGALTAPMTSSQCYSLSLTRGGSLRIGNWSGSSVTIQLTDCAGNVQNPVTITSRNDWEEYSAVSASSNCTVYLKSSGGGTLLFDQW